MCFLTHLTSASSPLARASPTDLQPRWPSWAAALMTAAATAAEMSRMPWEWGVGGVGCAVWVRTEGRWWLGLGRGIWGGVEVARCSYHFIKHP